jgi:outer membrane protein assembly factor BamB
VTVTSTSTGAVKYEWDLYDDGLFEDGRAPQAARWFPESGTFTVRLRVTGANGRTDVAAQQVAIKLPPGDLPRADEAVTYQQNASHDGLSESGGLEPPLAVAWTRSLPGRLSYPVMVGDRVFVTQDALDPEVRDSALYAFDRRTGATLWTRRLGTRNSNPVYGDGRLYIATDDGFYGAFDPATGATLWGAAMRLDSGDASVLHANGMLYTLTSGIGTTARALDARDGSAVWSQAIPRAGAGGVATADANNVYVAFSCAGAFAMGALSGWAQWWVKPDCTNSGGSGHVTALHDGRLYDPNVAGRPDGQVIDVETAEVVGHFPRTSGVPAFLGDRGFFVVNGRLQARDLLTDTLVWEFAGDDLLIGSPLIAGGHVFVRGGRLFAVDAATGIEAWRSEPGDAARTNGIPGGMAIARGTLITQNGQITAYRSAADPPEPGGPEPPAPAPIDIGPPDPGLGETRTYQGDIAHTGVINVPQPAPPLRERWRKPLTSPTHALVAGGRVFVLDRLFGGEVGGRLYALDKATAATLWSRDLPYAHGWRHTGIAYDAGKVFVGHGTGLYAFDAVTGAQLWHNDDIDASAAPPVAADGAVYLNLGSGIARFRQSDGTMEWDSSSNNGYSSASPSPDATYAYSVNACQAVYAVNRQTGERKWSTGVSCGGGGATAPLSGGFLLPSEWGAGYMRRASDGRLLDNIPATAPPAVRGNLALALASHRVHAYEFPSWRLRWSFGGNGYLAGPPLVVGRHAYVATRRGILYALDIDTGATTWSTSLRSEFEEYDEPDNRVGFAAGEGLLLVPTWDALIAYESAG